jgi:hypothetical protein
VNATRTGLWPPAIWQVAVAAGTVLGVAYTLSPLTVWAACGFAFLVWRIGEGLPEPERQRVRAILIAAILLRVVAIVGVWFTTDHARVPFASFFGDEEYFIRRATWLRNVALGVPIHSADLIYAFDDYSYTHYLYVIAFVEALVGFAPYGLKIVSAAMYLGGAVILFRLARPAYGSGAALAGLLVVLFLPSLFAWSIAALKEPPYFLVGALACSVAVTTMRTRSIARRIAGLLFLVLAAGLLQAIRDGGLIIAVIGLGGGMLFGWLARRPWAALAFAVAVPIAVFGIFSRPAVQLRAVQEVRRAAKLHWGHVNTPGYSFKSLDPEFYPERSSIDSMSRGATGRYLVRSAVEYLTVPRPWTIESRAALAFVPELMFWYCILALLPFGLVVALRRDALVTTVLGAYAFALAALVAVTGGNIGTLVRHRGLALPYLIWLSAVGADALLTRMGWKAEKGVAWP